MRFTKRPNARAAFPGSRRPSSWCTPPWPRWRPRSRRSPTAPAPCSGSSKDPSSFGSRRCSAAPPATRSRGPCGRNQRSACWAATRSKLRRLREGNTFLNVLRLQLVPMIPFGMLNYAAGTARLRFLPYWSASGLGIIPLTLAAVYVGDRLRAGVRGSGARAFIIGGAVMVGMLLLSLLPTLIAKRNERRAHEATPEAPPSDRRESLGAPARSTRQPQR